MPVQPKRKQSDCLPDRSSYGDLHSNQSVSHTADNSYRLFVDLSERTSPTGDSHWWVIDWYKTMKLFRGKGNMMFLTERRDS